MMEKLVDHASHVDELLGNRSGPSTDSQRSKDDETFFRLLVGSILYIE